LVEKYEGGDHSEDVGVDGRKILKFVLGKYGGKLCVGFVGLKIETGDGLL
jgi:hypothetical protein